MSPKTTVATEVEIFGSVYKVRGQEDPERLRELAAYVDGKMREVAQHVATIDTGKLAILAALNIADELFHRRSEGDGERSGVEEKVAALTGQLEEALGG